MSRKRVRINIKSYKLCKKLSRREECFGERKKSGSHILVYDLGGGTFDVTVLEMFEGVLEVKASSGDNRLGGKEFDQKLVQWLTERFETKYGVSLKGDVFAARSSGSRWNIWRSIWDF